MDFEHDKILAAVLDHWGWAIRCPEQIMAVNSMGNVFLRDAEDRYWRICPEELKAKLEAKSEEEVQALFSSVDYKRDWQFAELMGEAHRKFGELDTGECYAMKLPCVLGGEYDVENMWVSGIYGYLGFSGNLAFQIKDLPDGTHVKISCQ